MIYLEQTVEQIINEEGQLILSLSDLDITWEKLQKVFIGTFEQSKGYITVYDWDNHVIGTDPQQMNDLTHIRHITYNAYNNMQRFMPDVPGQYWEFNPYTKNLSSLMNTNFSLEVSKYPTCSQLEHTIQLKDVKKNTKYAFGLPFTPSNLTINNNGLDLNIEVKEITYDTAEDYHNKYLEVPHKGCLCCSENNLQEVEIVGDANGTFDPDTFTGYLSFSKNYDLLNLTFTSKYVGIKELDLTCELFYTWFKGNMLTMIGSVKKQIDMSGSGLPFDMNQDGLLERGRELMTRVEELKGTKSHWSNF